jgi:ribosomal protein S27AE
MDADNVVQLERVRCLECGTKYIKPADGGTVSQNPGCPRCGYVGWILATIPPASTDWHRSGEGRRLRLHAQLR